MYVDTPSLNGRARQHKWQNGQQQGFSLKLNTGRNAFLKLIQTCGVPCHDNLKFK